MKISALPLEGMLYRLRNTFNPYFIDIAGSYNVKPFELIWPETIYSGGTNNVIFGQLTADDVDSIGVTGLNRLLIFAASSANENDEKYRNFSGNVVVGCDFHLEWKSSELRQPFESLSLAVEDCFAESIQLDSQQNWGTQVVYNGRYRCARSTIVRPTEGKGSLRQLLTFRLDFQVNA